MSITEAFTKAYNDLNKEQKEAVNTIEGPVMVVAGPGTGKTQVLALRIANILKETDTTADSILCLTFTNSGVRAMRERLHSFIGADAGRVMVSTFHAFSGRIIEENYHVLGFDSQPTMLDDEMSMALYDAVLEGYDWKHIRPREDYTKYISDIKSLLSLCKKENMIPDDLMRDIDDTINRLKNDPENISSRGATKGQLKKEIENKIESLERTREVAKFYELYENEKKNRNVMDYDDELHYAFKIVESSSEARDNLRENYLYVLIDEHQDSSGVQNNLLKAIWQWSDNPNIFAVGDDRQLIYAFGGADISYFEEFKHMFGEARLITLLTNYRSTQIILDTADTLLSSSMASGKLSANAIDTDSKNAPVIYVEASYPRDEILAAAHAIEERHEHDGVSYNQCAILVPKNAQVIEATRILRDIGIPVVGRYSEKLFSSREAMSLICILRIISNSEDSSSIVESLLDPLVGIPQLIVHRYLHDHHGKDISVTQLCSETATLFDADACMTLRAWGEQLASWISLTQHMDVYRSIQMIGSTFLFNNKGERRAIDHATFMHSIEIIRSLLHVVLQAPNECHNDIKKFLAYIDRLSQYGYDAPVARFSSDEGVQIMTLHGAKGSEYDFVWVAHMNEDSLMRGKHRGFSLPDVLSNSYYKKDELSARREAYVAITRAKRFCTISYSQYSYTNKEQIPALILSDLPHDKMIKQSSKDTERMLLKSMPEKYVTSIQSETHVTRDEIISFVKKEFTDTRVSVSLLNNFLACPRKWYFRNFLNVPEPMSESLEMGNIIHTSLERILKMDHKPNVNEYSLIVNEEVARSHYGNDSDKKRIGKSAMSIIIDWVNRRLPEIEFNHSAERNISCAIPEFPLLSLYGKIDLIEYIDDNHVRVTDFKTGKPKMKHNIEKIDDNGRMSDYMRQLTMYSLLLEQNKKAPLIVDESRLEYLEAKKESDMFYTTTITRDNIDKLIDDIKYYEKSIQDGSWIDTPCLVAEYEKSKNEKKDECEYCTLFNILGL
ncbi:hypothetical protein A2997_01340 [Candidatus Nomurabacteria bacterium RIFCSPLOWO2_01_FULL_36_10b]|uniref:DNA 3'-5' helicase n=1 Tax=Candidatus Nomurabacteria bacterium RIFCSPLOWO2_01_FULL_36_10b TaxID=1801766 RepID=A0A1F6WQD1_9BACT|nr:MAG: hypothetical protein A2997_01340 [Candidatus Nomurabacteria bacterium RIFCSPLOWO2_01_FULL_36_10b]